MSLPSDVRPNRSVYKYVMDSARAVLDMPVGAEFISVGAQGSEIVVWAEVNPSNVYERRVLNACNTGGQLPADRKAFIGTTQIRSFDNTMIVWHVYEVER